MTSPGGASAGNLYADIHPDASQFAARLRAAVLPAARSVGDDIATAITAGINTQVPDTIRDAIRDGGRKALPVATAAGRKIGAAIKGQIDAALRGGFDINVDADTRNAHTAIGNIRRELRSISGTTIDITAKVKGAAAVKRLADNVTALRAVATPPITIDINANVTGSVADIRRLDTAVRSLRTQAGTPIDIDVTANLTAPIADVNRLARDLRSLNRTGSIHLTVRVDVQPPGVTAQLIAIHGILTSLRRMNVRAGVNIATGSSRGALQSLIALAIGIGPAIVPAAAAATAAIAAIGPAALLAGAGIATLVVAFSGVFDAVKALGAAEAKSAKTGATAANQRRQIASAQDAVRDANRGVTEAERDLTRAQADALRVAQDLNRAREEARDALEDLDSAVKNNSLSIRQANLDLADAELALQKVQNLDVNDRRRIEAQLEYDRARQQVDDLTIRQGRLKEEQEAASKAGIDGSEQVRAAQERIADSQERVRDAELALTRAREQAVAAQRNLQTALVTTGSTGGSAMDTLREKMAALTPAGQEFARFLHSLRPAFMQIKAAAEGGLFPGLQRGMEAMLPVLPQIVTFVGRVASAMGRMFEAAGKALASPFWQRFFDQMGQLAGPMFDRFGRILGAVAEGIGSLILAFAPLSLDMFDGIARAAEVFAKWAAGLADNPQFQAFLEYVRANGPQLTALFGQLAVLLIQLGIALAPLGQIVLTGLVDGLTWLNQQDPATILGIAGAVAALFAAFAGGPIALAVAATLIAGFFTHLYQESETFRNTVTTVWNGIKSVVQSAWNDFVKPALDLWLEKMRALGAVIAEFWEQKLKPAVEYIGREFGWLKDEILQPLFTAWLWWMDKVGTGVVWLWKNVLVPFVTVVGAVIKVWWENVVKPALTWIKEYVETKLGPAFLWLWRNVIEPGWTGIQLVIGAAWASIQVVFGLIQIGLKVVGAWFGWLYDSVVKPVWEKIRPIFELFGSFISTHVAPKFAAAVDALGAIWGRLQEAARVPIRFIVETVLNNGLLAAYNFLADKFNVSPKNVRINIPGLSAPATNTTGSNLGSGGTRAIARAAGGPVWGPGSGTSDSIPAWLSNGEYVIPARIVAQYGVRFFDWLIGRNSQGAPGQISGAHGPGFADGGLVDWAKKAWATVTDPIGTLKAKALDLLGGVPGAGFAKDVAAGVGRHAIGGVLNWAKQAFEGLFFGADRGGTGNFATGKFQRSPHGWPARAYHTLSPNTAAALAFLLRGWGPPAFSDHFRVGPFDHPWGKAIDFMANSFTPGGLKRGNEAASWMINHPGVYGLKYVIWRRQVTSGEGWHPYSGDSPHTDHAHFSYFADGGPVQVPYLLRDGGGRIPPGLSLVDNRTARDEWMYNDAQNRALVGAATSATRRPSRDVHIYPQQVKFSIDDLRAEQARQDVLERVGRPY